jgi:hypothetical protein
LEDDSHKAPAGMFRVIFTDFFDQPPEECEADDFPDLESAKAKAAEMNAKDLSETAVYDDKGTRLF